MLLLISIINLKSEIVNGYFRYFAIFGGFAHFGTVKLVNCATLIFNIEKICDLKNVAVTAACRESGVGKDFVGHIKRGSSPSVEKVQLLAEYLGVTTSDLLGEEKSAPEDGSARAQLLSLVRGYSEEDAQRAAAILRAAFGT